MVSLCYFQVILLLTIAYLFISWTKKINAIGIISKDINARGIERISFFAGAQAWQKRYE